MRTPARSFLALLTATAFFVQPAARAVTYDLSADWSDTTNPNGVWTYLMGGVVAVAGTRTGDPFANPPGAPVVWGWGSGYAGWSKSNGSEQINGWDLQIGDVYGHTPYDVPMQIAWTAPAAGVINVNGAVWALRDVGRWNTWLFLSGQQVLDNGSVGSGDAFSRATPDTFTLSNLAVGAGDILMFSALAQGVPDYLGLALTIDFSEPGNGNGGDDGDDGDNGQEVPDGGATALLLLGALCLLAGRRLQR